MSRDEISIGDGVDGSASQDAEVARVLDAYLADLEAGRAADPGRLLAEHPAIADQLRACLEVMHLAERVADDSGSARGRQPDAAAVPLASSLLATWNHANGPPPRVHLHDLTDEDEPLVRPRCPEMPATPEGSWGRYQLQGEIARGGMGAVIKGRDADLGRDLALKVLLESHRGNPEVVRRFIEEAQIGGQLQHPGIVPVYELGTCADRRPYFAMKLVKGRTLASLLGARTGPQEDLPRFLSIFEQVCQTMAYAHARGVIHRDLKPSNVMVGSFGEVQVMDWGLAKVLARGGVADETGTEPLGETVIMTVRTGPAGSGSESQAGSVLGTPSYMAPEQARGDVERLDERADVFGLGAILCEILTGRPPYPGSSRDEIRARAARVDLADALNRLDTCGTDSELVALAKACLAAEPGLRPRGAGEVSRRMTAYQVGVQDRLRVAELARVEAQARTEEAQARARIERSRRRRTVALAASVLGFVLLGGGGWAYMAAQRQERLAATTRVVNDALAEAERFLGQAHAAAVGQLTKWSEAVSAARRARDLLAQGESDRALGSRVETVLADLERGQAADQQRAVEIERDLKLLGELETIRGNRGDHGNPKRTDAEYGKAFRGFGIDPDRLDPKEAGELVARRSEPIELASYLDDWALVRRQALGKKDEASWRRLLAAAQVADKDPWRVALREQMGLGEAGRQVLQRLADDDRALQTQSARGLALLASGLRDWEERPRVERVLQRARWLLPNDFWVNYDLGDFYLDMGTRDRPHGRTDRPGEAARFFSVAVAIRPHSGTAHCNLGSALFHQGKIDEAIAEYHEGARLKPDDPTMHYNLGNVLSDQGRFDDAITEFREALRLNPDDVWAHGNLGVALNHQGRFDEAIIEFREALRLNPDDPKYHNNLGAAMFGKGQLDEAIIEFREALRLNPDQPEFHSNLGELLTRRGKVGDAITECREALRLKPDLRQARLQLGLALGVRGDFGEAIAELRKARDLAKADSKFVQMVEGHLTSTEHLASLNTRLPMVLDGNLKPVDAGETVEFAVLCYRKNLQGNSARFWSEAFRMQPKLAEDMNAQHRYNAACAAAMASTGQAKETTPFRGGVEAHWRKQAVDWLKADLAAWSKILDSGPPLARPFIVQTLEHWKSDTDLAGIRDAVAPRKLPADEQKACRELWAEVDVLLAKARASTKP